MNSRRHRRPTQISSDDSNRCFSPTSSIRDWRALLTDARLSEQETGLSTLFVAFGFLRWYESNDSDVANFAPLLLLPVQISKRRQGRGAVYSIKAASETPEINLSLRECMLRNSPDVARHLLDFDDEVDGIESYFDKVCSAIEGINQWGIERNLTLNHFAFGRLARYEDLSPDHWPEPPVDHPLLESLLGGSEAESTGGLHFALDDDLDDEAIENALPRSSSMMPMQRSTARFVRVNGNYKASRNPAEVARIVEAAIDFMIQHADLPDEEIPTLGIVAINIEQRDAIREEFNRSGRDEAIERYLNACNKGTSKRGPEPFFIKNLENVQGDEGDVIMISLTYGREVGQERVAQRFGPIARQSRTPLFKRPFRART